MGGSSIKSAVINLQTGAFVTERRSVVTPAQGSVPEMLDAIMAAAGEEARELPVGIAFPSVIFQGRVQTAAHINAAWIGQPLAEMAAKRLSHAVTAVNDGDAAGIAEIKFGAGRDVKGFVLVLTLGTGIGSAMFIDGKLIPNSELGHLQVDGLEAEQRGSGRIRTEESLSWDAWASRLSRVLREYQQLLWPDLMILCGGITAEAAQFFAMLECKTPLAIGRLRADAGIVGAAMAAAER